MKAKSRIKRMRFEQRDSRIEKKEGDGTTFATPDVDQFEDPRAPSPERSALFGLLAGRLSAEAQEVMQLILNTPSDLLEAVTRKRPTRHHNSTHVNHPGLHQADLRDYLGRQGWQWKKVENAFKELKSFAKSLT